MVRQYTKKLLRSANQDPIEHLIKYYNEQIKFFQREQHRWREFFKKNNITGDDLSRKLTRLQLLIDEGETNKRKVDDKKANLYIRDCKIATLENTIKRLTNEKEEYVKRCKDLEDANKNLIRNKQKIEEMQVDAEHTDRLHKQAIERARKSSRNEYLRATNL
ncbi:hypothetical protein F8M41_001818 [Gigaspora margarita]|uniref:Uncharacterized protein n=1 Tax=Gigaspora margarita TaxID=4874 RepID=A0A8H3XDT7_GIGMA|nr:hypothetical protein F8M41_001818 [Gigaspora margarita]